MPEIDFPASVASEEEPAAEQKTTADFEDFLSVTAPQTLPEVVSEPEVASLPDLPVPEISTPELEVAPETSSPAPSVAALPELPISPEIPNLAEISEPAPPVRDQTPELCMALSRIQQPRGVETTFVALECGVTENALSEIIPQSVTEDEPEIVQVSMEETEPEVKAISSPQRLNAPPKEKARRLTKAPVKRQKYTREPVFHFGTNSEALEQMISADPETPAEVCDIRKSSTPTDAVPVPDVKPQKNPKRQFIAIIEETELGAKTENAQNAQDEIFSFGLEDMGIFDPAVKKNPQNSSEETTPADSPVSSTSTSVCIECSYESECSMVSSCEILRVEYLQSDEEIDMELLPPEEFYAKTEGNVEIAKPNAPQELPVQTMELEISETLKAFPPTNPESESPSVPKTLSPAMSSAVRMKSVNQMLPQENAQESNSDLPTVLNFDEEVEQPVRISIPAPVPEVRQDVVLNAALDTAVAKISERVVSELAPRLTEAAKVDTAQIEEICKRQAEIYFQNLDDIIAVKVDEALAKRESETELAEEKRPLVVREILEEAETEKNIEHKSEHSKTPVRTEFELPPLAELPTLEDEPLAETPTPGVGVEVMLDSDSLAENGKDSEDSEDEGDVPIYSPFENPQLPTPAEAAPEPVLVPESADAGFVKIAGKKSERNPASVTVPEVRPEAPSPVFEEPQLTLPELEEDAGFVKIGSKRSKPAVAQLPQSAPAPQVARTVQPPQTVPTPADGMREIRLTPCTGVVLDTNDDIYRVTVSDNQYCDTVELSARQISLIGKLPGEAVVEIVFRDSGIRPMRFRVLVVPDGPHTQLLAEWSVATQMQLNQQLAGTNISLFLFQNRVFIKGFVSRKEDMDTVLSTIQQEFVRLKSGNPTLQIPGLEGGGKKIILVNMLSLQ